MCRKLTWKDTAVGNTDVLIWDCSRYSLLLKDTKQQCTKRCFMNTSSLESTLTYLRKLQIKYAILKVHSLSQIYCIKEQLIRHHLHFKVFQVLLQQHGVPSLPTNTLLGLPFSQVSACSSFYTNSLLANAFGYTVNFHGTKVNILNVQTLHFNSKYHLDTLTPCILIKIDIKKFEVQTVIPQL